MTVDEFAQRLAALSADGHGAEQVMAASEHETCPGRLYPVTVIRSIDPGEAKRLHHSIDGGVVKGEDGRWQEWTGWPDEPVVVLDPWDRP